MPNPRTCHGWLTCSLTFHRKWTLCFSQQYTAEELNKLADRVDVVVTVGEYRQMNLMMTISINFVSVAFHLHSDLYHYSTSSYFESHHAFGWNNQLSDWVLLSTYIVDDIYETVNKPFNCWSPRHATGHPGPSLLLLSPLPVLYTPQCDLTARRAQHHWVTICKRENGLNVEKRSVTKWRRGCWVVYFSLCRNNQSVIWVPE